MAEPVSSEITSRPPLVDFARENAMPPAPVYVGVEDRLYVRSHALPTDTNCRISGRLLHADGVIRPFTFTHAITGTWTTQVIQLAEGFLLSLEIVATSTGAPRGRAFVNVGLLRGRAADLQCSQLLIADYVANENHIGWPGGVFRSSLEGVGEAVYATITDPAAGAEWTITEPNDVHRKIHTLRFTFATNATVANRFPRFEIVAPTGNVHWRSHVHAAQTASTSVTYNFAVGTDFISTIDQGEAQNLLPDTFFAPGVILRSSTVGLQAGDDYSAIRMTRETWSAGA